jgi:cobalt-zinc-cadmium efflux system protein
MGGHEHGIGNIKHERPLWWAFGLTATYLVAELLGAYFTKSLALLSDAAHMATDTLALLIALASVRLSRRPADARRTFGFVRMEAMGAMANGLMLFGVAAYILWEAWQRFQQPPEVASTGMLVVATIGLVVNLISMRLLKAGSGQSLNMKGAYLEVWSDMLGSLGVIVAAVVIKFTGWWLVDTILAVLIGLWVLPRTWTLLKEASQVLMMGVPKGIDLESVRSAMLSCPGVTGIHDLHIWALASNQPALTAHIVVTSATDDTVVRDWMITKLEKTFHTEHVTLQVEREGATCPTPACDTRDAQRGGEHP